MQTHSLTDKRGCFMNRRFSAYLKNMFLSRLGFEQHAMDTATIKLRDLSRNHVKEALGSIGLDDETLEKMKNFVDTNPDTTLQNLLDQINTAQTDDSGETKIPSKPGKLPRHGSDELLRKSGKPLGKYKSGKSLGLQQPPDIGSGMSSFMGQYGQTFGGN